MTFPKRPRTSLYTIRRPLALKRQNPICGVWLLPILKWLDIIRNSGKTGTLNTAGLHHRPLSLTKSGRQMQGKRPVKMRFDTLDVGPQFPTKEIPG
jgi:hypothetical protein